MKYIKNLERNMFWKQNKFGYTNDINEAGLFDEVETLDILRDANIFKVEDLSINEEEISKKYPKKPFDKKDIKDVLAEINTSRLYETNPISFVFNKLFENHYYPEKSHDNLYFYGKHINYNETFNENIKINSQNLYIKLSIYRNEKGFYELTVYDNYDIENKEKIKKTKKIKP